MASMRDIKRRKESISSTGQITKAMKLVATVKLQKAKARAENSRPYFEHMYEAVCSILNKSGYMDHPMLTPKNASSDKPGEGGKRAVIVITSNRGLAGGDNSNIVKLVTGGDFDPKDTLVYAVGRKGKEALARRGYEIAKDYSEAINEPIFADAAEIGTEVMEAFREGKIREIYLAYTVFKNTVSHIPTLQKILPVESDQMQKEEKKEGPLSVDDLTLMNYEPEADEALNLIIPKYVNSLIYGALTTAIASENGARMQAMDSATSNAEDMISDLELKYNRARQGAITQELTEIIAGANAIS